MFQFIRKKFFKSSKDIYSERVAVDIGLDSIKCAYLKNNYLYLNKFKNFNQVKDISKLDQQEIISAQMKTLKKVMKFVDKVAGPYNIVFSPQVSVDIITRVISMKSKSKKNINIPDEDLPFDDGEYEFDAYEIPIQKTKDPLYKFLFVASRTSFIMNSINLFGGYQNRLNALIPDSVGLINFIISNKINTEKTPIVLIDIGTLYSQIIIIKKTEQIVSRIVTFGGNDLNLSIAEHLNIDIESAEKMKNINVLIDNNALSSNKNNCSFNFQAIEKILDLFINELKETMTYFEDYYVEDLSNSTILLSGGTSQLKNLDLYLKKETGLSVKYAENKFFNVSSDHKAFIPQYVSTIGLLSSYRKEMIHINLLKSIKDMLFNFPDGKSWLIEGKFYGKKARRKRIRELSLKGGPVYIQRKTDNFSSENTEINYKINSFLNKLSNLIRGNKAGINNDISESNTFEKKQIAEMFKKIFVVVGALFLIIMLGYEYYWKPETKRMKKNINYFLNKRDEFNMKRALTPKTKKPIIDFETKMDKILWTSKLKFIADALPNNVRILIFEMDETKGSNDNANLSLMLTCQVKSKKNDHLEQIALFISNLKKDISFNKDFKPLIFHSADKNKENDHTVDFTLTFPFSRKMLKTKITKKVVKPEGMTEYTEKLFKKHEDRFQDYR